MGVERKVVEGLLRKEEERLEGCFLVRGEGVQRARVVEEEGEEEGGGDGYMSFVEAEAEVAEIAIEGGSTLERAREREGEGGGCRSGW